MSVLTMPGAKLIAALQDSKNTGNGDHACGGPDTLEMRQLCAFIEWVRMVDEHVARATPAKGSRA